MLRFRPRGLPAAARRARPALAPLAALLAAAALAGSAAADTPPPPPPPTPAAPMITSFGAQEISPGLYLFSGTVEAEDDPEGLEITFGGDPVSLRGQKASVGADGSFSLLIQLKTDGSDDGTATAVCTDGYGQQSNVATTYVTPSQ